VPARALHTNTGQTWPIEPASLDARAWTTAALQALIADTAEKSPAFRAMLDRLEASTVIVYVRIAPLPTFTLDGRTPSSRWTRRRPTRASGRRAQLHRPILAQTATLAHELRHAIEIADAPWVVGPKRSSSTTRRSDSPGSERPAGAVRDGRGAEAAAQVRRELAARAPTRAGLPARTHAPAAGSAPDRCDRWDVFGRDPRVLATDRG
jgi:hypothetical protein